MSARVKPNRPQRPGKSFTHATPRAPIKLVLEHVRCFARVVVPLDAGVTVIIGQNGAGKTTIAEAIASLAHGEGEGLDTFPLRRGATTGVIELRRADGTRLAHWNTGVNDAERDRLHVTQLVFVYGQYRALRPPPVRMRSTLNLFSSPEFEKNAERPVPDNLDDALRRPMTRSLFNFDDYLFRDLSAYVALLEQQGHSDPAAQATWERLRQWLESLDATRIEGVEIVEQDGRRMAAFRHAGVTLPLSDLSDGYRAMLAVVLDLAIRYTKRFGTLDNPLAGEAMVVIDEVELNLHPRWQRREIEQLTALFPNTRFVLTTHSIAIVQAAIDNGNSVLVLDEAADRTTIVRPLKKGDIERLNGAELDSVLVDEAVFGAESRYSPTYERIEKRAQELREKLEEGEATPSERRELLKALDELQGLVAREEQRESKGPLLSEIAKTQIALLRHLEREVSAKVRS